MQSRLLKNKSIWITGGSTGIGYGLTKELLKLGNNVIATSRNPVNIEKLKNEFPKTLICASLDVSNKEDVLKFSQVLAKFSQHLDLVILNAGQCIYIDTLNFNSKDIESNIRTNFLGMVYCIETALPFLRKSNAPHLIGMTSSAAYIGLPRSEGYGSSKAAARYFLQSLQVDLHKEKIDVTIISPGFVKTPLTERNDFPMPWIISVDKATKIIINGISKRKPEIRFPMQLIWIFRILNLLPDKLRINFLAKNVARK